MVDISKGTQTREVQDEDEMTMTSSQRRSSIREILDEMDEELTDIRYDPERTIREERDEIVDAYTDRMMDVVEES